MLLPRAAHCYQWIRVVSLSPGVLNLLLLPRSAALLSNFAGRCAHMLLLLLCALIFLIYFLTFLYITCDRRPLSLDTLVLSTWYAWKHRVQEWPLATPVGLSPAAKVLCCTTQLAEG